MRLKTRHLICGWRAFTKRSSLVSLSGVVVLAVLMVTAASAQQTTNDDNRSDDGRSNSTGLAVQNLSQVAASATQIKVVLAKDPGLMVALKRWVAKDATDHGQIIGDSDLTDEAIYERLETDVQFRSVATALLQRYGYLLPKYNPDSAVGKEQDLLIKERTKWIAQREEEQLTEARQRDLKNTRTTTQCDSNTSQACGSQENQTYPMQRPGQSPRQILPSLEIAPQQPNPANPTRSGTPRTQLAQLLQNGGTDASDVFSPISSSSSYDGTSVDGNASLSSNEALAQQVLGSAGGSGIGRSSIDGSVDSQISQGATVPGLGTQLNGNLGNGLGTNGAMAGMTGPPYSNEPMMQPYDRYRRPQMTPQTPELIRKQSPYYDVPSLYDMYVQASAHPSTPQRFGTEVFENETQNPNLLPMDLPVGPSYVVGPGDGLSIDLWGGVSERLYRTVDREGRVSLPEVGPVLVSGKSLAEVQQNVQRILGTQFRDVSADVSLARLRTVRIYEVGDVEHPGAYDVSSLSTPLNALFVAGGPTSKGSMRIVEHYRGNRLIQVVDLYDLLLRGVKGDIKRLENGDTVLVPPVGPQVTIDGMVRRPAIYELRDEKTLASVIELAGGLLPTAALSHIEVQRLVAHQEETMLSLDIPAGASPTEVTKKLESFKIENGDRIRIFPIAPYNQNAIYLEGHVIRPGRYSYHKGMRVTDLISSYKDLLPEPATRYAEIIRLNAPDFQPSVESFNLADAFANPSKAPLLHPMDTVRIFGRYDFENPPTVSVLGDVRMPGTYRTSGQIHLSDAIHLAGGLSPDAQTSDAQVFRHMPNGNLKIFSVHLAQALQGDPMQNILLQPRDRLLIHRSPQSVEPASVYIEGEVAKPGRYPLTSNMRVADLIRVGGGLKPSAETKSADLTEYQWSQQTELTGEHKTIALSAALTGDSAANVPLRNGDVLTVRQLPGWDDLGASITLKGEVKHPGTYGIRPGERLSSVIERAGGFQPDAYPFGAILQRTQVRELQRSATTQMVLRVKDAQSSLELLPDTDPRQKQAKLLAIEQWQSTLNELEANPPLGRVTIRISSDIRRWKDSNADIQVRAGDVLTIPKRPSYVMVAGQVFNSTAISYRPGKSAKWYLNQAGGPTQLANKKAVFVIRADGTVIGKRKGLWIGNSLDAALQPGDTVVVPEKALGGGVRWQSILLSAQVASSIASSVFFAMQY